MATDLAQTLTCIKEEGDRGKWKSVQPRKRDKEERSTRKIQQRQDRKNPWVCAEMLRKCLLMSGEGISCQLSKPGKAPQD